MGAKTRRLRSIIAFAALGIIGTAAAAAFEAQLSSQLRPRIEIGCRFPLDKEVGDSLSSC